ncbi:hypothetical protein Bca4012_076727 [Brassica carinata]
MKRKKENPATDELSVRSHRGLPVRSVSNRVFNDVTNRTTTPVNNLKRSIANQMDKHQRRDTSHDTDVCSPTSAPSIPVRSIFDRVFNDVLNGPRIPFTPVTSLNLSVGHKLQGKVDVEDFPPAQTAIDAIKDSMDLYAAYIKAVLQRYTGQIHCSRNKTKLNLDD